MTAMCKLMAIAARNYNPNWVQKCVQLPRLLMAGWTGRSEHQHNGSIRMRQPALPAKHAARRLGWSARIHLRALGGFIQ
jgi:hypothetical protein